MEYLSSFAHHNLATVGSFLFTKWQISIYSFLGIQTITSESSTFSWQVFKEQQTGKMSLSDSGHGNISCIIDYSIMVKHFLGCNVVIVYLWSCHDDQNNFKNVRFDTDSTCVKQGRWAMQGWKTIRCHQACIHNNNLTSRFLAPPQAWTEYCFPEKLYDGSFDRGPACFTVWHIPCLHMAEMKLK